MTRSSREVTAEAIREIDSRLEGIEKLLGEIKGMLVKTVDDHNEQRHHVRDQIDRLGTRVYALEHVRAANGR